MPGDLGAVAVDVGPGLFTGLRVGVAAAKALAQSLGIGVISATSLDILTAAAAESGQRGLVLACVDARRGEVFASLRELDPRGTAVARAPSPLASSPRVTGGRARRSRRGARCSPSATARSATAACSRRVSGVEVVSPGLGFPPPAALLRLAIARLAAGESPDEPAVGRSPVHT